MATEHGMVKNLSEKEMYDMGLDALKAHIEETRIRVMKSRDEGKGNFKYIEGEDYKRESRIADALQIILSRMYHKLNKKLLTEGHCGAMCAACTSPRYNFHSKNSKSKKHWMNSEPEGWHCQAECECK